MLIFLLISFLIVASINISIFLSEYEVLHPLLKELIKYDLDEKKYFIFQTIFIFAILCLLTFGITMFLI